MSSEGVCFLAMLVGLGALLGVVALASLRSRDRDSDDRDYAKLVDAILELKATVADLAGQHGNLKTEIADKHRALAAEIRGQRVERRPASFYRPGIDPPRGSVAEVVHYPAPSEDTAQLAVPSAQDFSCKTGRER